MCSDFGCQHIAYEYAKKGARLALVGRRENLLMEVADRAITRGASDVKVLVLDVTKEADCKRFLEETIQKYGRRTNSFPVSLESVIPID